MAAHWYDVALAIWRREAVDGPESAQRELANALYNRAFVMVAAEAWDDPLATVERRPEGGEMLREALAIYEASGDTTGEANVLWGLGGFETYGGNPVAAEPRYRRALELHRAAGHRTMEAWSLHMLAVTLIAQGRIDEAQVESRHALRHFRDAGDVGGMTLSFDALAATGIGQGDLERGGRLWGAARQLERVSGTGLARWDETVFQRLPSSPRHALAADDRERLGAEGASLPLDQAIAYALGEADPFAGDGTA